SHQLIAPAIQNHRSFASWADGVPARVRQIAVGTTPQTYTAMYVNRPPSVSVTATSGQAPFAVMFGAAAADPEGDTLSYQWDFGDGQTSVEVAPTHSYAAPGTYRATLTVADALGASSRATLIVRIASLGQVTVLGSTIRLPMVRR